MFGEFCVLLLGCLWSVNGKERVSECLRPDSDLHLRRLWTAGGNVKGLNYNVRDDDDMYSLKMET